MKGHKTWLKKGVGLVAAFMVCGILVAALAAPAIVAHAPNEVVLSAKLQPPSRSHLLGTDHLGRDILSRLLYGARVSVGTVALIVTLIFVLGFTVGCAAGYCGGLLDAALMRFCDIFLTFPTFILAMFMVGILGTGLFNVVIAIVLTHWAWYARLVRGLTLSLRSREFILASQVAGTSHLRIVLRHIFPPVAAQLFILATLDIGHMMLHVSGLSFLGLGVTPPTPEWGVMINDARQFIWTRPALVFWPGMMIFVTVMAFNLLGDALRDRLDPSLARQ